MDLARIPPNVQLQPINLVTPGFLGLNTMQANALLQPVYATKARNAILDANGRLAARDGVTDATTTDIDPAVAVESLFEYYKGDGTSVTIVAWDGGIADDIADPEGNDVSGSVTDTSGSWKFVNFNDKCIGFQAGQKLIIYTGTTFATVSEASGTAPSGGIGTSAFGRIWQTSTDGQTIQGSALLDETRWLEADGGVVLDMRNIWTEGTDSITAIAAFNGSLVVFGKRHIAFFVDGKGSALGLDPDNMYLADIIAGVGCVNQHSIQSVGETDLLFVSTIGVHSIKRLLNEKSAPMAVLSKYVRDDLATDIRADTSGQMRSTYNEFHGFYLLSFPASGRTWCLDQRSRYRDSEQDECSVITDWTIAPTAMLSKRDHTLYLAIATGGVGIYEGDTDLGSTFRFIYQSPWFNLGDQIADRLKILKRLGAILFVRNQVTVIFKWFVDFSEDFKTVTRELEGDAGAEYGSAEFGLDEFSGGLALRILKVPARGRGQYFRIGIEADVSGEFAVQQAELFAKIGRLA